MRRRRILIGGAVGGGILLLGALLVFLLFGQIAAWAVKSRVLPRVERRLGRDVVVGGIDVNRERVVLRDVQVRGERDAEDAPLLQLGRVEIAYDFWGAVTGDLVIGDVLIDELAVRVVRGESVDNVSDLVARFAPPGGSSADGGDGGGGGRGLGLRPARVVVGSGSVRVTDITGAELTATIVEARYEPGEPATVELEAINADSGFGPWVRAERLGITVPPDDPVGGARVAVFNGQLRMWTGFRLTGIHGEIAPSPDDGRASIDFAGGYGGVEGDLWTAVGWIDPADRAGNLDLTAERFTLGRLRPILEGTMVQEFDDTSVDVAVHITAADGSASFRGEMNLSGLNVYHAMLSDEVVRGLGFSASFDGAFDGRARELRVASMSIDYRDVPMAFDGFLRLPGGIDPDTGERRTAVRVAGHLVVPPVPCQKALRALPRELTPHLQGFALRGSFDTDLHVDIDWHDLEATQLGGPVNIWRCKVKEVPKKIDAERLLGSFEHSVERAPEEWRKVVVGFDNPDFVPLYDVSPLFLQSLQTTEDGRFYKHKGFTNEFRTALVRNLQEGYFKYGGSSITMQTVKNIWLSRDKLLARKLQELFLTWYIETQLEKDRILEIYVNAIEYGPGLYGIGPASQYYFGKHARDLNAVEAAFFSMMLPGPKPRHDQYCEGELEKRWARKIERILAKMHERGRLTDEEYALAQVTPLVFYHPPEFDKQACLDKYGEWVVYWLQKEDHEVRGEPWPPPRKERLWKQPLKVKRRKL